MLTEIMQTQPYNLKNYQHFINLTLKSFKKLTRITIEVNLYKWVITKFDVNTKRSNERGKKKVHGTGTWGLKEYS